MWLVCRYSLRWLSWLISTRTMAWSCWATVGVTCHWARWSCSQYNYSWVIGHRPPLWQKRHQLSSSISSVLRPHLENEKWKQSKQPVKCHGRRLKPVHCVIQAAHIVSAIVRAYHLFGYWHTFSRAGQAMTSCRLQSNYSSTVKHCTSGQYSYVPLERQLVNYRI